MAEVLADEDEISDVVVERMPDLDGWEFFKALDGADDEDRWTLAISHAPKERTVAYALWADPKKDPAATGVLDGRVEKKDPWARSVRRACQESEDGALDDPAREEVILAILERDDPTFAEYEERLAFSLEPDEHDEVDDHEGDEDDT